MDLELTRQNPEDAVSARRCWSRLALNGYRKATDPDRRCKNCKSRMCLKYHDKLYNKCRMAGATHGTATDIRLGYTCRMFEGLDNE